MKRFIDLFRNIGRKSEKRKINKAGSRNMALLYLLYIVAPLIIIDCILAYVISAGDNAELEKSYMNVADGMEYHFKDALDYANNMAQKPLHLLLSELQLQL